MDRNSKDRVINKINDISDFVQKSTEDLETIKGKSYLEDPDCQLNPNLKIVALNADKVF